MPRFGDSGVAGPAGPDGPPGPPGPAGAGSFQFVWTQAVPSVLWTVVHNLNGFPNVAVVDSANTTVIGHVSYLDANSLQIEFANAFGGYAYLS